MWSKNISKDLPTLVRELNEQEFAEWPTLSIFNTTDADFKEIAKLTKLKNLNLEQNKTYHIGTGQSSDSLMWGNREGILDALFEF